MLRRLERMERSQEPRRCKAEERWRHLAATKPRENHVVQIFTMRLFSFLPFFSPACFEKKRLFIGYVRSLVLWSHAVSNVVRTFCCVYNVFKYTCLVHLYCAVVDVSPVTQSEFHNVAAKWLNVLCFFRQVQHGLRTALQGGSDTAEKSLDFCRATS